MQFRSRPLSAILAFAVFACVCAGLANAQVKTVGAVTAFNVQNAEATLDFVNAKPMPLPSNPLSPNTTKALLEALQSKQQAGTPGYSPGGRGTGIATPEFLGTPAVGKEIAPQDFGGNDHPFSTARADLNTYDTNKQYPYRPAGKLYFLIGGQTYWCSASLIEPGVIVAAGHCAANYGASQFYSGWQFSPGYRNGTAPYKTWTVKEAWVLTAYYNGTDNCAVYGIVCPDDVSVLILNVKGKAYPGTTTGWFGYGWNGFGFVNSITQITQLGYPGGLDNGALMERNDSYGYVNGDYSNNTIIGSNMNGGSSGGPWVVNFGIAPTLTGESDGSAPNPDIVVGVTSWGYTDLSLKEQGASPFTSNNITVLVNAACSAVPAACGGD
jgi:V8-like Glu-specific endopeptidase